ncbi:hypothetical protein RAJCM14343_4469 [Rhodococcus aetherivorans]|uniref:Uncharacterized protein n=1 Tax=Rhodococcus aetherivorans TaxID=191292 RepID=A0ABQ0YRH0_9NOCA|nr:hypothetical protein RAJCM14343_4469 [Rhodococcus aetherivorans]CCW15556.1 hypothetical protein EBESD8_61330 [Rhodococcus aetherivorans]
MPKDRAQDELRHGATYLGVRIGDTAMRTSLLVRGVSAARLGRFVGGGGAGRRCGGS